MDNNWHTKQDLKLFESLGRVTTQVLRLAINASLKRHNAMLQAMGVDLELSPINTPKRQPQKAVGKTPVPAYNLVETVRPKENSF